MIPAPHVRPAPNVATKIYILVATFGAGLTCGAGIIKWGDRVESISESSKSIPDYDGSIFDLMKDSFNHYGINASHLLTP